MRILVLDRNQNQEDFLSMALPSGSDPKIRVSQTRTSVPLCVVTDITIRYVKISHVAGAKENAGIDGKDLGADIDALEAATAGAE
jgi:hypothetical protein